MPTAYSIRAALSRRRRAEALGELGQVEDFDQAVAVEIERGGLIRRVESKQRDRADADVRSPSTSKLAM
jgi:hypothetical protein